MSVAHDKTKINSDAKITDALLETLRGYHSKIDDEETRHTVIGALSKVIEDLEEPFDLLMRLANSVCHMKDSCQAKANDRRAGRHDAIDQSWLPAWRVQGPLCQSYASHCRAAVRAYQGRCTTYQQGTTLPGRQQIHQRG